MASDAKTMTTHSARDSARSPSYMRAWRQQGGASMRVWMVAGATLALVACGGPNKQQKAAYAEASRHFVPPTTTGRAEYGGIIERRFHDLDHNGDQYLTPDELPTRDSPLMAFDKDGDGRISAQEWSDGMLARFDRDDLNKDGSVTSVEREAARKRRGKDARADALADPRQPGIDEGH